MITFSKPRFSFGRARGRFLRGAVIYSSTYWRDGNYAMFYEQPYDHSHGIVYSLYRQFGIRAASPNTNAAFKQSQRVEYANIGWLR